MHKNILKSLALILLVGKIDTASAGTLGISITCDGEQTNMSNPYTYYNPVSLLETYPGHTMETKINNHGNRGVFLRLDTLKPQKYDIQSLDFPLGNNKTVSFLIQKEQGEYEGVVVTFQKKVNGQFTDNPIRFTYDEMSAQDPNFKPQVELIAGDTDVRFVNTQANPS